MVEYALLAGFFAVIVTTSFPTVQKAIRLIFILISEALIRAGGGGGGG